MISIIICSINPAYLSNVKANIESTIGIDYEILVLDNRNKNEGIGCVYNRLSLSAQYDILLFLHEDVIFHTNDWGHILINLLANQDVGMVGISGAVYKSKYPGPWSACNAELYRTHSIQHFSKGALPVETNINPGMKSTARVAVIDGVFMACRKSVFSAYKFDERNFDRFHGYDLDLSLNIGKTMKILVTYDILLEHISPGMLNRNWISATDKLHRKWRNILPVSTIDVEHVRKTESDYFSCSTYLQICLKHDGFKRKVLKMYFTILRNFFDINRRKFSKKVLIYLLK